MFHCKFQQHFHDHCLHHSARMHLDPDSYTSILYLRHFTSEIDKPLRSDDSTWEWLQKKINGNFYLWPKPISIFWVYNFVLLFSSLINLIKSLVVCANLCNDIVVTYGILLELHTSLFLIYYFPNQTMLSGIFCMLSDQFLSHALLIKWHVKHL